MGRLAVREATAEYFAEANLPHVGVVHPALPEIVQEQDYETNRLGEAVATEDGSSAVLVIHIPTDTRQRRADTGRGAVNDSLICKVVMEVFFASTGGDAISAQKDYDAIIDSIVALIRANATFNAPAAIWSAGEYTNGIQHQQTQPFNDADGLATFITGAVRFDAYQWIAGPV